MKWWKKRLVPNPTKPQAPIVKPSRDMVLERWQKEDVLVNWARTSPEFADALAVVVSQQPTGFPVRGQIVTDTQCALELGRKEGYSDALAVLTSLRQFPIKVTDDIPADYDNTEYPEVGQA